MRKASNIFVYLIITLILSVMACSVLAEDTPAVPPNGPPNGHPDGGFDKMVQNLSEQGFDVSKIRLQ